MIFQFSTTFPLISNSNLFGTTDIEQSLIWKLTRGLQAKSTSGGCNLHTKVCKCNSSIKNLKFDQIASIFFEFFQKTTPVILIICLTSLAVPSLISSASKLALVTFEWKQLETRCLAHFKDFFLLFWFSVVFGPLDVVIHIKN